MQTTEPELKFREQVIFKPNMSLSNYIKPVIAPSFEWITFLALNGLSCSRLELINISKLLNIGVLAVGPNVQISDGELDDSLVRAWARAASESNAFGMLRVLACRRQKGVTAQSFQHLSLFPALSVLGFEDCKLGPRDKAAAKPFGWQYQTGQQLSKFLIAGDCDDGSWNTIMKSLFSRGSEYCVDTLTAEGVDAVNSLPMLSFAIGGRSIPANVDKIGRESMRCFYRLRPPTIREPNTRKKRQPLEPQDGQPPKKRALKVAKHVPLGNTLTDFGF